MNKVYKCIWNASLGTWVAVSELASSKKKTKSSVNEVGCKSTPKATSKSILLLSVTALTLALSSLSHVNAAGTNSITLGKNAKPIGNNSIALGENTVAAGENATVIGGHSSSTSINLATVNLNSNTIKSGLGLATTATNFYGNIAARYVTSIGTSNAILSGSSVAIGNKITILNGNTISSLADLDNQSKLYGDKTSARSVAVGDTIEIGANSGDSIALGVGTKIGAGSKGAISIGAESKSGAVKAVALGMGSSASATDSVAIGSNSQATLANTVSFGSSSLQRKLTFVAPGAVANASFDAVNGSQLFLTNSKLADSLGGGSKLNADGSITGPSYTVNGKNITNVGAALSELSNQISTSANGGTPVLQTDAAFSFQTNGQYWGTLSGRDDIKLDQAGLSEKYFYGYAIGRDAIVRNSTSNNNKGNANIAFGDSTLAEGSHSIAMGAAATANGGIALGAFSVGKSQGVAVGREAIANTNSVAIGAISSAVSTGGVAIGRFATVDKNDAIALGRNAKAVHENAIAIGAASLTSAANTVSFGSSSLQRKLTFVAPGAIANASFDAVNGSQLYLTNSKLADSLGGGSKLNADGSITGPSYTVNGKNVTNVGAALSELSDQISTSNGSVAVPISTSTSGDMTIRNKDDWLLLSDEYYKDKVTTGGTNVAVGNSILMGENAVIENPDGGTKHGGAVLIGSNARGESYGSVVLGASGYAKGSGTAIGTLTVAGDSAVAVGRNALANNKSTAIGRDALAKAENSIALGNGSSVTAQNSIAIGNASTATAADTVSFGNETLQRKLTNVNKGIISEDSVDAVNGSQLYATGKSVADALGGGATIGADGKVTAPTYTVDGKEVKSVGDAISNVDGRVTDNTTNISNITETLNQGAFSVSANGTGAVKVAKDATIDYTNKDGNINITQSGTDFQFNLADQLTVKDGIKVGTDGPSLGKDGIDAANKVISNVGTGTVGAGSKDAVTGDQLFTSNEKIKELDDKIKDSGLIGDDGKAIAAVTYDKNGNVVLTGKDGSLISNVTGGSIAANSSEAINGSQLYATGKSVADALGGGATIGADGKVTAPTYTVDGKEVKSVGDAISNVDGRVTDNTSSITSITETLNQGAFSVSANGTGAVKVAKDATIDYTNKDGNINITQSGTDFQFNLADQLTVKDGIKVGTDGPSLGKDGIDAANKVISNVGAGTVGAGSKDAVTGDQLFTSNEKIKELDDKIKDSGLIGDDGKAIAAVTYDKNGNVVLTGKDGSLISNVKGGSIAANSSEAINGSQLYATGKSVADALGGGATIDADGKVTAPTYTVDGKEVKSVGDAISNVDGRVTDNTSSISNITETLNQGAFSVSANGTGAVKVAKDATIDYTNKDGNIKITQSGTDFQFNLADQLTVKDGIKVGTDGPSLGKDGIDAAGTVISNIKDGVNAGDAVSKGQLDKRLESAGVLDKDGKAIAAVTYDKNGNVVLTGKDGSLISNVKGGSIAANSSEAINGSQLYATGKSVADALGGGATIDADGKVTAPTYTVDGKEVKSVGDAISNVDGRVTDNTSSISNITETLNQGAFSVSANGTGAVKVAKDAIIDYTNKDGNINITQSGTDFQFNLADQLTVKDGIKVGTDGPSLGKDGIDAANKVISNVGTGTVGAGSKDAVTGDQLFTSNEKIKELDDKIKDSGLIGDDGKAIAAVTYDKNGNVVLTGKDGSLISNVKGGSIAANSSEAINGSQLYATGKSVADALGGGATIDADGKVTAPTYTVDGKEVKSVGDAISNVDGRVTDNTSSISNITETLNQGAFSVSANGTGAVKVAKDATIDYTNKDGNIKITQSGTDFQFNLADQLTVKDGIKVGTDGPSLGKDGIDAANKVISNVGAGTVGAGSKDAVTGDQLFTSNEKIKELDDKIKDSGLIGDDGKAIAAVTYDKNGNVVLTGKDGSLISNVTGGSIAANSSEAINGSQLYATGKSVADALGGGATIGADGKVTAPTYTVDGKEVKSVGDAISNVDGRVTDNTSSISNITETLNQGAFSVSANGTGAVKVAKDATIDYTNKDGNIKITQSGTDFEFDLADTIRVKKEIQVGGITLSDKGLDISNGPNITQGGINAGGTRVTNIGKGALKEGSSDAVTGGQLYDTNKAVADALGGGSTVGTDGKVTAPTYTVDGKEVKSVGDAISNVDGRVTDNTTNISNITETLNQGAFSVSANGTGAVKVAKDATIDYTNKDGNINITQSGTDFQFNLADQLTVKDGIKVGTDGPSLGKDGIDAAGTVISNIKDGVNAGDAVSKGQLDKRLESAGVLDKDGNTIAAVTYGDDDNVVLKGKDGSVISNLGAGKITDQSTEAVNGSQLYATGKSVADALGGGATIGADGKVTAPSYTVDGKTVNNLGDAISNVDGRVTDNTTNITNITETLNQGAFSVSANGTGAVKVEKDATINYANKDGNIKITQSGTDFQFNLADQLTVKDGIKVGTDGPSLGKDGIDAAGTVISNIKDGINAGDAVSKGQLDKRLESAGVLDKDGNAIAAVTYGEDGNVVLKGKDGKASHIRNVAAGTITATSTDAVNGAQIYNSNKAVADALGGGATVDADGKVTAPTYTVDGKTVNNLGDAITNVDKSITNVDNRVTNITETLDKGAFSVSANGTGAVKVEKDATINYANKDGNINITQSGTDFQFNLADQLTVKDGIKVGTDGPSLGKDGIDAAGTVISNIKDGINAGDAVSKGQLDKRLESAGVLDKDGNAIAAVTYGEDGNVVLKGKDGKASHIRNVAAGTITATSTDAVNGAQIYNSNKSVADALGGGATVDADGKVTAPTYTVDGKTVNNLGDAITNVDKSITNVDNRVTNITETLDKGAFSVSANGTGAVKVEKDATINYANKDGNINITQSGTDFEFDLADTIKVDNVNVANAVKVGNNVALTNKGLEIVDGPSITQGGINAGGTRVTNLAKGALTAGSTDAVIGSQLFESNEKIKDLNDKIINSGIIGNAVTYDDQGVVTLRENAGKGTTISNVAAGTVAADSTEAVNGAQIYSSNQSVANALGGGATVGTDGKVTAPSYSVDGKTVNNLGDAISNVDGRVTDNTSSITSITETLNQGAFSVSANGTGAVKVAKDATIDYTNKDGNINITQSGTDFQFNLADQLTVKDGIKIGANGPSITKDGIDAAGTVISNIKDGINAGDAVSKGQLDKSLKDVGILGEDGKLLNVVTYDESGKVSLNDNAGQGSTLTNVANGKIAKDSRDAINGGQLFTSNENLAKALGGGAMLDNNGNLIGPNYQIGGQVFTNIGGALSNIDGRVSTIQGQVNNIVAKSEGTVSYAVDGNGQVDKDKLELAGKPANIAKDSKGNSVVTSGGTTIQNVANGVTASDAVNKGQLDKTLSDAKDYTDQRINDVTNGMSEDISNVKTDVNNLKEGKDGMFQVNTQAPAVKPKATAENTLAGGSGAEASAENAVALGNNAVAKGKNSVALGQGSVADRENTVSVGSEGKERQITNVAAGTKATDAVNVSQLNDVKSTLAETQEVFTQQINDTNRYVYNVDKHSRAGIAGVSAMANIPQVMAGGQKSLGVGVGSYRGQNAIAVGGSFSSDDGKWVFKGSAAFNSQDKSTVGAGVSRVW
ncbi:hypothetical protein BFG52_05560 [Acinetobacter larvae]|uniref:Uncharacterized protein n=1 Tax=Acinetobacter larvae TaxID=1789224 RepID=A0A1B2LY55_9GAMM|nr:YadA-like family protein [Acinetobacter larvae]AOA57870.1 hypothetical protein BFG52_05560 [Acinetobacter larvae]